MGCWNATCNISNLPICAGEKVVMIPLYKSTESTSFNTCYPWDNFVPFAFPLIGDYDDYGGIENVETCEENKKYLMSQEYYIHNSYAEEGEEPYKKSKKYDNFDEFVQNVLCCVGGVYFKVNKSDLHPSGYAELNFMMVHYNLYHALLDEMYARVPYGQENTYKELVHDRTVRRIRKHRAEWNKYTRMEQSADEKEAKMASVIKKMEIGNAYQEIFNSGSILNTDKWKHFITLLMENPSVEDELVDLITEQYVFHTVLSYMRKGYLCDSGCGSQSCETRLHAIMAEFIMTHIMECNERMRRECVEYTEPDENGTQETLYWYDRD